MELRQNGEEKGTSVSSTILHSVLTQSVCEKVASMGRVSKSEEMGVILKMENFSLPSRCPTSRKFVFSVLVGDFPI